MDKMNKINRLLLINNYKILKIISKKQDDKYYDRCIEILENGYTENYDEINYIEDEVDEKIQKFVLSVICLYNDIYNSYLQLKDKQLKNYIKNLNRFELKGFDGNDETVYMSYLRFLLEDDYKWYSIKKIDKFSYNSHNSMIDEYRDILQKSSKYLMSPNHYKIFEPDELIDILKTEYDENLPLELERKIKIKNIKTK
jgi:uncharacterized protein YfbU (UPF0304 family)